VNLDYQDQLEQERADSRNAVEEYVYGMRDKLVQLEDFITAEDKTIFNDMLSKTEDWLYDEGEDQPKKVYVAKLVELRKLGDPVVEREKEFAERPGAFNELGTTIIHYEKFIESYTQGVCACV
jgi:molecular chaperone DnaK (HSP70)